MRVTRALYDPKNLKFGEPMRVLAPSFCQLQPHRLHPNTDRFQLSFADGKYRNGDPKQNTLTMEGASLVVTGNGIAVTGFVEDPRVDEGGLSTPRSTGCFRREEWVVTGLGR